MGSHHYTKYLGSFVLKDRLHPGSLSRCNENQGSQRTATIRIYYCGSFSGIILLLLYANPFAISSHLCVSADPSLCNRVEIDAPDHPHRADSLLTYWECGRTLGAQNSWSSGMFANHASSSIPEPHTGLSQT